MKLKASLGFLLLLVSLHAQALSVFVGHNVFFGAKDPGYFPYAELFWEIDPATLSYETNGAAWFSRIQVEVTMTNDTGIFLKDQFVIQTPSATSQEKATKQPIVDLHRYEITYGKIKAHVTFTEVSNPSNKYTYTENFTVEDKGTAFASGLQLLDTAYASTSKSPFQRNGMQHIPISIPFMDVNRGALNYYFEAYGLDKAQKEKTYVLKTFISKKVNENALLKFIKTDTLQPGAIIPVYGSYDISGLASGNYYLNVSVFDEANNKLAGSSLFFQRANKKSVLQASDSDTSFVDIHDTIAKKDLATLDLGKTFVARYSHAQLKGILKMVLPIADEIEAQNIHNFAEKPDEMYTRYFVYNFWLNRNPDKPEKAWEEYAEKVREVNKMFPGGTGVMGYETDRGYTYLKYGKPNERIIVTTEQGALPYEIWQYFTVKTQGRDGVFLFYRPDNLVDDYKVLHTTVINEAKDLNWRNSLYPNGRSGLVDSKAEEYLRNR
jgi:GWxTD domain-containing protein